MALLHGGMRPTRYASTPSTLPPPDLAGVITLDQVRPVLRSQNEYVDTPRATVPLVSSKPGVGGTTTTPATLGGGQFNRERVLLPNRTPSSTPTIISTQPVSTSPPLKKDFNITEADVNESIVCSRCGKCRCGACTQPRDLPSKWLCGDKVNLSPETAVEYCTCMCLVKGCFYHYTKDEQEGDFECVSDPCACCSQPECCNRWTCMLAASLCLPCLCLYWPAKCTLMACTACYNKCRKKGCTCNNSNQAPKGKLNTRGKLDSASQYRGLLVESESSSNS